MVILLLGWTGYNRNVVAGLNCAGLRGVAELRPQFRRSVFTIPIWLFTMAELRNEP